MRPRTPRPSPSSTAPRRRPPAGCFPSRPTATGRARPGGSAAGGSCWRPARAPSAFACRWTPSRGRTRSGPASRRTSRPARRFTPASRASPWSAPTARPTTALTIEERDGHIHVFLPPTQELEGYADLLHVIELAAVDTGQKLVLEGYGPPPDARLTQLSVTPDPGVIEVNVQPTSSWAEQRDLTFALYEHARAIRLTTEKFDLDGTPPGHRRRQSPDPRRPAAGGVPAPAPARAARELRHVLAAASELSPICSRAGSSARRARRRASTRAGPRPSTRWRSRSKRCGGSPPGPKAAACSRGSWTGRSGTC